MIKRFTVACLFGLFLVAQAGAQSVRPGMGATPYADETGTGVTFRVWAPNATTITVFGDFNGWDTNSIPLEKESPSSAGLWSVDASAARSGDEFWYSINDAQRRRDPRARQVVHSRDAAVIYDPGAYWWETREFIPPSLEDLVLYELHIGTYYNPDPGTFDVGNFHHAIEKLDHLAVLGVNAVQVMPVAEFPGDNSWGYNPSDLFAVESAYGGPDAFKAFVDACHARGLAVILDVVHNHYGSDDLEYSLWNFDGWPGALGGGIYFYQDPDKAQTPWGPRPDYSRPEVRDYIMDNIRMWIEEYRVDGFRWDATMFIRYTTNFSQLAEGRLLLREVSEMMAMEFPEKIHIAEDLLENPLVTAPLHVPGGFGFDSDWMRSFHVDIVAQLTNAAGPDLDIIAEQMNYTGGMRRVIYTESHDEVGYLNVDEGAERVTTRIDPADPFSYRARKLSTLGAALVMTAPGIPMIFQGQEMLEDEIFSTTNAMDWAKADTYEGIVHLYRDLIQLRRNLHGVSGGLQGAFSSVSITNSGTMLLVHRGVEGRPEDDVYVIANFSAEKADGYWINFPHDGTWHVHVNSESSEYGFEDWGSEEVFVHPDLRGDPDIAPMSVLILSRHPPGPLDSDRDGIPDAWEILHGLDPNDPTDAWLNPDGDALTNLEEYWANTDPNVWNLPASHYGSIHIAGTLNSWSTSTDGMALIRNGLWQRDLQLIDPVVEFKFVANESWDEDNWGAQDQERDAPPLTYAAMLGGGNIVLSNLTAGIYRFRFDENRLHFTVRRVAFADSDNDGIPDDWELEHGLDPLSSHDALLKPSEESLYTYLDLYRFGLSPDEDPPPLTDYDAMGVIFDFNDWNVTDMNMTQAANTHYTWVLVTNLFRPHGLAFKFAANGSWDNSWGGPSPEGNDGDWQGEAVPGASDIVIGQWVGGVYRFTFNEQSGEYTIELTDEEWMAPTYSSMAVAGTFNEWNVQPNMTSNGLHEWSMTTVLDQADTIHFKYAANGAWEEDWGSGVTHPNAFPLSGVVEFGGANITVQGPFSGEYTFTFNSATYEYTVTFDGYLPAQHEDMAVAGSFNGWNTTPNMTLNELNEWVFEEQLNEAGAIQFKFVTGDSWGTPNWGDSKAHATNNPATGTAAQGGGDISVPGPYNGLYRFTFNDRTWAYRLERVPQFEMKMPHWEVTPGGGLVFQWVSEDGAAYEVQRATVLAPTNDFDGLSGLLPATPPLNTWTSDIPPDASMGFFRIRVVE